MSSVVVSKRKIVTTFEKSSKGTISVVVLLCLLVAFVAVWSSFQPKRMWNAPVERTSAFHRCVPHGKPVHW